MAHTLTVNEAARRFTEIVARVYHKKRSYLLTENGVVVAQLTPTERPMTAREFARRWHDRPKLAQEDATAWYKEITELKANMDSPIEKEWAS
ncbi:MAG: hypothetical protein GXP42_10040 [Chloroflexi bacterium]|nr:hypothetical protein [Chloroflexota bacterium]